jgi:hypothetical protein
MKTFVVSLLLLNMVSSVASWSIRKITMTDITDRRWFAITTVTAIATAVIPSRAEAANSEKVREALDEMRLSKEKLQAIPDLLEEKEWDKVRSILKLPPVNKLWNLGDVSL